ncbi:MAG TPA: zinc-binding dehydrogenase [Chloroflexota bacterium]
MDSYTESNVLRRPGVFEMERFPVPVIGPEDLLLRVELVGVCGGDIIEYEGRNYKAHYPMILGHEIVGHVLEAGAVARQEYQVAPGDRVSVEPYIMCRRCTYCLTGLYQFCTAAQVYGVTISSATPPHLWGAYGQLMYVAPGSRVHRVAEGVDPRAACLASVIGNGVRWIRTIGKTGVGERVLILGSGAQGLASIVVAREAGAGEIVVVAQRHKVAAARLAAKLGASVLYMDQDDLATLENRFDVAVECTGDDTMLDLAIKSLRPTGRLIQVGTRGGNLARIPMDQIVFKELALLGGLGQSWDTEAAVRIINSGCYPIHEFISQIFPVAEADAALRLAQQNDPEVIHLALSPS